MCQCIVLETRGILSLSVFESLAERVRGMLWDVWSNVSLITCASSLANHGLLGSVYWMRLEDVDLTSVPTEPLASLASSVIGRVLIENVSGSGLVTILDNVKSEELVIYNQSLNSEETQALVRAMESRVEEVRLHREVTLDIRDLMEYSGQGKCREVRCYGDTADRYREQLRTWATSNNWTVTNDQSHLFIIQNL